MKSDSTTQSKVQTQLISYQITNDIFFHRIIAFVFFFFFYNLYGNTEDPEETSAQTWCTGKT